jgi:hypothetical protein
MKRASFFVGMLLTWFLAVSGSRAVASSWQQVAALTISGCDGCLVDLALSPSGQTVVVGYSSEVLLYEQPASGWTNTSSPTTLLICSDSGVFAIGEENFGVATNDSTVVAEAYKYINNKETQVLLVWQLPANGWASQSTVSQSFELVSGVTGDGPWNSVAVTTDTIAVGDRSLNSGQGAVWVWNNPPSLPYTPVAELTASDAADQAQLGYTVSISGNTIAADRCSLSDEVPNAAYVFVKPPSGWANSTETAKLTNSADGDFGCFITSNSNTVASGIQSYNNDEGRVDIFAKPSSGWSNSSTPSAELLGSSSTGTYLGISVHFGVNATGDAMLVASSPYLDSNDGAENIYYEPPQTPYGGWTGNSQQPNYTISFYDPAHFGETGLDGAGANTVVFADCGSQYGCGSPIHIYQYQ